MSLLSVLSSEELSVGSNCLSYPLIGLEAKCPPQAVGEDKRVADRHFLPPSVAPSYPVFWHLKM